jgi:hypothetical protein
MNDAPPASRAAANRQRAGPAAFSGWGADAAAAFAIVAVTGVLYSSIRRLWWMSDDFFHLRFLSTHSINAILFDPAAWRDAPFRMFTPGLFLSLALDRRVGGLDPGRFYFHQLASAAIAGAALYFALRGKLSRLSAAGATFLAILGLPMCRTVSLLCERHYIDGLAAAVVALLLELRVRQRAGRILSAGAYFAAMCAKEVYAPLIILFAALAEGNLRARVRRLFPHGVAFVVYLGWRWKMLGTLGGGYGWAISPDARLGTLARLLPAMLRTLTEGRMTAAIAVAFMLLAGLKWVVDSGRIAAASALALAAVLPIVPVASAVGGRHGLLASVLLAAAFGAAADHASRGRIAPRAVLLGIPLALLIAANRAAWREESAFNRRMSAEARGYRGLGGEDALSHPAVPPAAMGELAWLESRVFGRPAEGRWFYDDIYLCGPGANRRAWAYDAATGGVRPISEPSAERQRAACSPLGNGGALSAEFRVRGSDLFWTFGPYVSGYRIVLDEGAGAYDVPREAGYQLGGLPAVRMRVEYRSPGGGAIYSPVLTVPLGKDADYRWQQGARPGSP